MKTEQVRFHLATHRFNMGLESLSFKMWKKNEWAKMSQK